MGTTPIYGFPYPDPSDLVANYPALGQQLAEDVEDAIVAATPASITAEVLTTQSTASTSYTDLATVGPSVTLTTGTKALVIIGGKIFQNTSTVTAIASFAVSGATTLAASDKWGTMVYAQGDAIEVGASRAYLLTGLTAGSNVFTMKYRVGGGLGFYSDRNIIVIDMGS